MLVFVCYLESYNWRTGIFRNIQAYFFQTKYNITIPGEDTPKDKLFTKLHRAIWNEDIDAVKKYVLVDRSSTEQENKFSSTGRKKLKLAAANFVGTGLNIQILWIRMYF